MANKYMNTLTIIHSIVIIYLLIRPYLRRKYKIEIDRTYYKKIPYAMHIWRRCGYHCWEGVFYYQWRNPEKINDKP